MHSIHLEFNTLSELQNFMAGRPVPDEKAPILTPSAAPDVAINTPVGYAQAFGVLQDLLTDPRFEWRKVATVCTKTSLSENEIIEHFQKEGIDYEITTGNQGNRLIKATY